MGAAVPFNDAVATHRRLQREIESSLRRVAASGWYIGGGELESFEQRFAAYVGSSHAVGVANGTDAIALALRALGIGPGSQVIVPALSAYPTTVAVVQAGAVPSFVDVDRSGLIDVADVERALSPAVRAVVAVHLYGNCADGAALARLCSQRGLDLVEDCAQAHGAARDGVGAGRWGKVAAWSFYPTKNLGALGDAGAITCDDGEIAARVHRLRNYGQQNRYEHVERGVNSRLDPIQSAVLAVKLAHLEEDNQRRRTVATRYDQAFADLRNVTPLCLPGNDGVPNRHLYPVLIEPAAERPAFQAFLAERGVETLIHYPIPMPAQKASESAWSQGRTFPQATAICSRVVSLPVNPELTDAQVVLVIDAVCEWAKSR